MYTGNHSISMDAKGRMAIPSRYRDDLVESCAGKIVMTANPEARKGGERCIWVYPDHEWQRVLHAVSGLPTFNKAVQRIQRLLMGYATEMEMDSNGRVLVPPTLRDYAGLDKKLMLVAQGKKFELWSEERWYAWLDDGDDEDLPPEALSLSL